MPRNALQIPQFQKYLRIVVLIKYIEIITWLYFTVTSLLLVTYLHITSLVSDFCLSLLKIKTSVDTKYTVSSFQTSLKRRHEITIKTKNSPLRQTDTKLPKNCSEMFESWSDGTRYCFPVNTK